MNNSQGKLSGKVVVITGSAAGIGRACSLLFAREGASVAAIDRDQASNAELVREICQHDGRAEALIADVSQTSEVEKVVSHVAARWQRIDILFNNAGVVPSGKAHTIGEADWDRVFAVNVKSMFLFSKAVIPMFLRQGGGIILNTASATALRVVPDRVLYNATKSAVLSLTRSMALDYAADNIRVNCLCPGTVDTPSLRTRLALKGDIETVRTQFIARQPLRRLGTAEEVAQAALYLVSPESSFVTGAAFQIDGGMSL